jgi:hypothetical protein
MKAIPNRLVVARGGVRPNRAPMFGIGPDLMTVQIAKK